MSSTNEEKLREELAKALEELQILQANYEVLKNSLDTLVALLNETRIVKSELKTLNEHGEEKELLIPLGTRVLLQAKIKGKPKILYALGAGVLASLPSDEVDKKLSDFEKKLTDDIAKLQKDIAEILRKIALTQELAKNLQNKLMKIIQSRKS
ncbi:MAG: prefoldin subunit alpha [Desulfurococcales archaeon ex4484_217_2]|nr:MAG: prefoldin subunit alpha [Desulfurococcales archaeon ex4484_217_2]